MSFSPACDLIAHIVFNGSTNALGGIKADVSLHGELARRNDFRLSH